MNGFTLLADGIISTQDLSNFNPASPPAESIRSLFILVLAITAAIFLLVDGVLVFNIVRFRRSTPGANEPRYRRPASVWCLRASEPSTGSTTRPEP
jgi:heme/copper-type cytochrome/quinol oxidase subunit 2